jgi:hypothetical protein
MANLKALREKIKNITDYSPDLQQYNDQLDELINDSYYNIWTAKRWSFATKEYLFKFIPDMLPTRDVITPGASIGAVVNKGSRLVDFTAPMDRLTVDNFEGQPIEIQNYEYLISKVIGDSQILLDKPFHGTSTVTDYTWIIKRRWYDLPHDSIELLSLAHRDVPNSNAGTGRFPPYGKLTGLMPRREEELNLRMDYKASYAEAFVWSPSFFVPEAYKTKASPVISENADGFPNNTYLEVCWAFLRDGKVGALSEPQTVYFTPGQGTHSTLDITFRSWDDQDVQADAFQSKDVKPSQFEGLRKVVFWNSNYNRINGERLGLPVWRVFTNPGGSNTRNTSVYLNAVIAADTAASVSILNFNQIDPGNETYIEQDGQYNRIRPYPRVDSWDEEVTRQNPSEAYSKVNQDFLREGVARYYYKPSHLGFHTDSPEMPYEFHQLIAYDVLATLYDKTGSMSNAENYRRRIEREIKRLEKRYCDHIDSAIQRGQFVLGDRRSFYYDYASLKTGG